MLNRLADQTFRLLGLRAEVRRITGKALVLDGDSIVVAGQKIRLHGIDAPEMDQTLWCRDRELMCGAMALAALEALTAGMALRCDIVEHDRFGRTVAKVYAPNGIDICKRMVWSGWALAYRQYSRDYIAAEKAARKARRGLWRGQFIKPWEWRASYWQRRQAGEAGQRPELETAVGRSLDASGARSGRGR